MKALVTGASSGIGMEIAKYLDKLGYVIILVARNKEKLDKFCNDLNNLKFVNKVERQIN